jgi:hypothetical protein
VKKLIISFPGGSGGNWLKSVFENEPVVPGQINFHTHTVTPRVRLVHSLNTNEFDYLLSGTCYFNFYLNVLYKFFYKERNFFENTNYKEYYTCCVSTARFLCQFDTIKNHIFFNFDDLIDNDKKFYSCLNEVSPTIFSINYQEFILKKNAFFNTLVDTSDVYENFNNQYWVTFVLGQLMNLEIYPDNFSIYSPETQKQSAAFAYDNYKFCKLNNVHHFKTGIELPNLPVK